MAATRQRCSHSNSSILGFIIGCFQLPRQGRACLFRRIVDVIETLNWNIDDLMEEFMFHDSQAMAIGNRGETSTFGMSAWYYDTHDELTR